MKKSIEKSNLKESIKKQLISKLKENYSIQNINEEEMITDQPEVTYDIEDQIGNFWIVKKAIKESTEEDLLQELDVFGLAEMINQQQISRADIHGIYQVENKAKKASLNCIKARDKGYKESLKEGDSTLSKLEQSIQNIKTEIEGITQKGVDNPGSRDSIAFDLEPLYTKLSKQEELLDRLSKSLEAEKKSTQKEDE